MTDSVSACRARCVNMSVFVLLVVMAIAVCAQNDGDDNFRGVPLTGPNLNVGISNIIM